MSFIRRFKFSIEELRLMYTSSELISLPKLELSELILLTNEFIPSNEFSRFERMSFNGKLLNSFETSAKLVVMDSMLSNVLLIIDRFSVKVFSIIVAELFTAFIAEVKTSIDSLIFS